MENGQVFKETEEARSKRHQQEKEKSKSVSGTVMAPAPTPPNDFGIGDGGFDGARCAIGAFVAQALLDVREPHEWAAAHLFREHEHVCAAQKYFDSSLAAFLREAKTNGLLNRTMVVLAGDV
mgnify:CR=1 FL=1